MSFLPCSQDFHQFSDRMKNQPTGDGSGIVKPKGIFNEEHTLFFPLLSFRKLPLKYRRWRQDWFFPEESQERSSWMTKIKCGWDYSLPSPCHIPLVCEGVLSLPPQVGAPPTLTCPGLCISKHLLPPPFPTLPQHLLIKKKVLPLVLRGIINLLGDNSGVHRNRSLSSWPSEDSHSALF